MDKHVEVGAYLWTILGPSFSEVVSLNSADFAERVRIWSGFMGAALGAMGRDIGAEAVQAVLDIAMAELDRLASTHERRH